MKHFLDINWEVRFRNPNFWIGVCLAIVTPILTYFGLTGQDFTTWKMVGETIVKAVQNPYVVFTVIVSVYNMIVDPTTHGIKDSKQALTYDIPKKD